MLGYQPEQEDTVTAVKQAGGAEIVAYGNKGFDCQEDTVYIVTDVSSIGT